MVANESNIVLSNMAWEEPSFVEIEMNAEIGSYQEDYDGSDYEGI